jgi:FkbM family methyltransferase
MAFAAHMLEPGDLFVDVGANVGAYTILACSVGARCISIEPSPQTFARLAENVRLNDFSPRVNAINTAAGAANGELSFTSGLDTVDHVVASGEISGAVQTVRVEPLDALLAGDRPVVIKIDVEGFETEVLRGASATLSSSSLEAIVIEMNGSGARYGYDEGRIHDEIVRAGFSPVRYTARTREIAIDSVFSTHGNRLYVRDVARAKQRVANAPPLILPDRKPV